MNPEIKNNILYVDFGSNKYYCSLETFPYDKFIARRMIENNECNYRGVSEETYELDLIINKKHGVVHTLKMLREPTLNESFALQLRDVSSSVSTQFALTKSNLNQERERINCLEERLNTMNLFHDELNLIKNINFELTEKIQTLEELIYEQHNKIPPLVMRLVQFANEQNFIRSIVFTNCEIHQLIPVIKRRISRVTKKGLTYVPKNKNHLTSKETYIIYTNIGKISLVNYNQCFYTVHDARFHKKNPYIVSTETFGEKNYFHLIYV